MTGFYTLYYNVNLSDLFEFLRRIYKRRISSSLTYRDSSPQKKVVQNDGGFLIFCNHKNQNK